jgi:hypothetical protein
MSRAFTDSINLILRKRTTTPLCDGGRARDRTLDLSRVKAGPRIEIMRFFNVMASFPRIFPGL